jgi:hypothetical protein
MAFGLGEKEKAVILRDSVLGDNGIVDASTRNGV